MRIYISADIEGIAGVVTYDQTDTSGFEYERAAKLDDQHGRCRRRSGA